MPSLDGAAKKVASDLSTLTKLHLDAGLFTHVYAECGNLDSAASAFHFSHCPGSRTIFDLSSMTKAYVTAPLIFNEIKANRLSLAASVKEWLGDVKHDDLAAPLLALNVEQLLGHRSGLPAWRNFYVGCITDSGETAKPNTIIDRLNRAATAVSHPGKDLYSDVGPIFLGLCLERKKKQSLAVQWESFLKNYVGFDPVASPLLYGPQITNRNAFVPTGYCAVRRRQLVGEVHDENCAALGGVSGHAGLFGSGTACGEFLRRFYRTEAGALMFAENQKRVAPGGVGLVGLRQGSDLSAAGFGSGNAMGHWGFTGTGFWICPHTRHYGILLTNRVLSGRRPPPEIKEFRQMVFGYLYEIARHYHR